MFIKMLSQTSIIVLDEFNILLPRLVKEYFGNSIRNFSSEICSIRRFIPDKDIDTGGIYGEKHKVECCTFNTENNSFKITSFNSNELVKNWGTLYPTLTEYLKCGNLILRGTDEFVEKLNPFVRMLEDNNILCIVDYPPASEEEKHTTRKFLRFSSSAVCLQSYEFEKWEDVRELIFCNWKERNENLVIPFVKLVDSRTVSKFTKIPLSPEQLPVVPKVPEIFPVLPKVPEITQTPKEEILKLPPLPVMNTSSKLPRRWDFSKDNSLLNTEANSQNIKTTSLTEKICERCKRSFQVTEEYKWKKMCSKSDCRRAPNASTSWSNKEIVWLENIMKRDGIKIRHCLNGEQVKIQFPPGSIQSCCYPDGFCEETNTVYEFYGDLWHGNPKFYKREDINPKSGRDGKPTKTFGELYDKTMERERILQDLGYNIVTIWEHDFDQGTWTSVEGLNKQ